MADTRVALAVDGMEWRGWTALEIVRSVERVAGGFALALTDRWIGQAAPRPIHPGLACTLAVDGEVLVTGWIDDVEQGYDAESRRLLVRGRDRTGDLFDCAAVHKPFEILGLTLEAIAARLCAPFGVGVTAQVDVGKPFARFAIQPGETVWEAIERGCRQRAVLPMPDGRGNLVLTRAGEAGEAAGPIVLGGPAGNVLACAMTRSARELFSEYVILGQQAAHGAWSGVFVPGKERAVAPDARLVEPSVTRYRPTLVLAEMQGSSLTLMQRAEWQRAVAAGKAVRGTYTVQDWRHPGGALWQPNTIVQVTDRFLGLDGAEMLVAATKMRLTEAGTITEIEVAPRDAYRLMAETPSSDAAAGDSGAGGIRSSLDPFAIFDRPAR